MKVETLDKISSTLDNKDQLEQYAENQQKRIKQETQKFAELYPANTVKPNPIHYGHFRFELDELMLNCADIKQVLTEVGIKDATFLGFAKPDECGYTYVCYKWEKYFLLFPLCQDFFFMTEDREHRLADIWSFDKQPIVPARIMHQHEHDVIADAIYNVDGEELYLDRIYCPNGPYLIDRCENVEKVRNLIHYLRDKLGYDMNREEGHTDLPNSVRLN